MGNVLKTLFYDARTPKPGKSSLSLSVRALFIRLYNIVYNLYRNDRSGVDELVEREPLMFARVENSVTIFAEKRTPNFCDQKQQFNEFSI